MTNLQKLRSRTEWQAYLLTIGVLFLNHFLDMKIDENTLWMIVASSSGYGVSRGVAKLKEPAT